jgi:hypothetical protein
MFAQRRITELVSATSRPTAPEMPSLHRAVPLAHEVAPIPGARLAAEVGRVGRAHGDEPGFRQHLLGRGILPRSEIEAAK